MKKKRTSKYAKQRNVRVARTRNAGTWTEARYWQQVRSSLRNGFKWWKPATNAKLKARRAYKGDNKAQKWEYLCANCKGKFLGTKVQIDHIKPVGSLRCREDLIPFLEALTAESGYQLLCKQCHQEKTNREKLKNV